MTSSPPPCAAPHVDPVLPGAARRRPGGARPLAHPAGDVPRRPRPAPAGASGRRLGARARPARRPPAPGRAAAPLPAGDAAPAPAQRHRDRDLAARPLRDLRPPRAAAWPRSKPLDEATDAADYGSLVHGGMQLFLAEHGTRWPPGAARPPAPGDGARPGRGRAARGARRVVGAAPGPHRRLGGGHRDRPPRRPPHRRDQARGVRAPATCPATAAASLLIGRADRIERRADGALAILDYKTGTPPTQKEVDAGLAPQLLLEAAMAEAGAFGAELAGADGRADLLAPDRRLRARRGPLAVQGRRRRPSPPPSRAARDSLGALIDAYDQPDRCYLSQPHPARAPALLRLRPVGPRRRMGRGGRGGMKTRKISQRQARPQNRSRESGRGRGAQREGEGDRVAPNCHLLHALPPAPPPRPPPRVRAAACRPDHPHPRRSRLDLSRTRGRGSEPRPGPTPP